MPNLFFSKNNIVSSNYSFIMNNNKNHLLAHSCKVFTQYVIYIELFCLKKVIVT